MKGKQLFRNMWILAAAALAAAGCEKEQSAPGGMNRVSDAARSAFEALYPGAGAVRWEVKGEYAVAAFDRSATRVAGSDCAAWFVNASGSWSMTETDIRFDELPEAVKQAFAQSEYASWQVEEVDRLDRNGVEVVYVIEVRQAASEMDLYYAEDGVLVKSVADAGADYDYGDFIPSQPSTGIESFIASHYPGARIIDVDVEYGGTEIELVDADRVKRELFFDGSETWQYTKTEVRRAELPAAVVAAWEASDYAESKGYRLDDADLYETAADGTYYRLDLESRSGDVKVRITPDGMLTLHTAPETGGGAAVGTSIEEFIAARYPGAVILEKDNDDGYLEVDIRHEGVEKELLFNGAGAWVRSSWDVRVAALPVAVTDAVRGSSYADYRIDGADYVETPDGAWYEVELEGSRDREVTLRITAEGSILTR